MAKPFQFKLFVANLKKAIDAPTKHLEELTGAWEKGDKRDVQRIGKILKGHKFARNISQDLRDIVVAIANGTKTPLPLQRIPPNEAKKAASNESNAMLLKGESSEIKSRETHKKDRQIGNPLQNVNKSGSNVEIKSLVSDLKQLRKEINSDSVKVNDTEIVDDSSKEVFEEIAAMRSDLNRIFQKKYDKRETESKETTIYLENILRRLQSRYRQQQTTSEKDIKSHKDLIEEIWKEVEKCFGDIASIDNKNQQLEEEVKNLKSQKENNETENDMTKSQFNALKQWISGVMMALENPQTGPKVAVPTLSEDNKRQKGRDEMQQLQKHALQLHKEIAQLRTDKENQFKVFDRNDDKEIEKSRKLLAKENKELKSRLDKLDKQINVASKSGEAILKDANDCYLRIIGVKKDSKLPSNIEQLLDTAQKEVAKCAQELDILLTQINNLKLVRPINFKSIAEIKIYIESCGNNHIDGHTILRFIEPLKKYMRDEENLHNKNKTRQNIEVHPELQIEDMVHRIDDMVLQNNNDIKRIQQELEGTKSDNLRLREQYSEIEQKKNEYQHRLSKLAGAKLTEDNANIADLSDPNRPTKIAEQYSELYDNEWTDAFGHLDDAFGNEKDKILSLLRILQTAYDYCRNMNGNLRDMLQFSVVYPVQYIDESQGKPKIELQSIHKKALTDFMRQTSDVTIRFLKKDFTKKRIDDERQIQTLKSCPGFVEKCLELCWFMTLQTPPVVLYTGIKPGDKYDTQLCKTYTKTGKKIDFLVWPPLLLHKDGDVLYKGVAQCK